jgi:hypothetical protein
MTRRCKNALAAAFALGLVLGMVVIIALVAAQTNALLRQTEGWLR